MGCVPARRPEVVARPAGRAGVLGPLRHRFTIKPCAAWEKAMLGSTTWQFLAPTR